MGTYRAFYKGSYPAPDSNLYAIALPWFTVACFTILAIPMIPPIDWRIHFPSPALALAVREEAGQLRISWNPAVSGQHSKLEILDGLANTLIPIPKGLSNATYAPQTNDVQIRLIAFQDQAEPRRESVHFLGQVKLQAAAPQPVESIGKRAPRHRSHARKHASVKNARPRVAYFFR